MGNGKKVFIDLKSTFALVTKKTGKKMNGVAFAKQFDVSSVTLNAWSHEAPRVVEILHKYLKEHDLKFEDLVKEY